jgi:hypothetical protein
MDRADPWIEHALAWLRQAAEQKDLWDMLGKRAADDIARQFGLSAWSGVPHLQRLASPGRAA